MFIFQKRFAKQDPLRNDEVSSMKHVLPKQHGAWAMLILPFAMGVEAGEPSWFHLPLFLGWLFLYLATYPLLMAVKGKKTDFYLRWFLIYISIALLALIIPVMRDWRLVYFGFFMLPFFLVNAYYSRINQERCFINDLSAVGAFGVGGLASYYLGTGQMDGKAFAICGLSMLFFIGSIFFVKTMIREKKNAAFRWLSWSYHLFIPVGFMGIGMPLLAVAYIPSAVRAIALYGKPLTMMHVGILEIVNSLFFLIVAFYYF